MRFLSLVSPLAVAAALVLTPAAYAQTTVGSQTVSEADMAAVQSHCDELAAASAPAAGAAAGDAAAGDAAGEAAPTAGDAAAGAAAPAAGAEAPAAGAAPAAPAAGADAAAPAAGADVAAGTPVDIEAITIEDCRAADLVE